MVVKESMWQLFDQGLRLQLLGPGSTKSWLQRIRVGSVSHPNLRQVASPGLLDKYSFLL